MVTLMLVALAICFLTADAFSKFSAATRLTSSALQMGAFGAQTLGKSVLDTDSPEVAEKVDAEPSVFKHIPIGSGADERKKILHEKEQEIYDEEKYALLSNIDKTMKQRNLMMGLQGDYWGENEKLNRIKTAAGTDGLLPASLNLNSMPVQAANLKGGGLLDDDWDF
jgi:hypothetical protein